MIHWTEISGQLAQSGAFKAIDNIIFKKAFPIISADNRGFIGLNIGGNSKHIARTKTCTLIARSVDYMTEQEYGTCLALLGGNIVHSNKVLMGYFEGDLLNDFPTPLFLYLISIGVLPPSVSTENVEFTTTNGE